jgi:hypothetical protein
MAAVIDPRPVRDARERLGLSISAALGYARASREPAYSDITQLAVKRITIITRRHCGAAGRTRPRHRHAVFVSSEVSSAKPASDLRARDALDRARGRGRAGCGDDPVIDLAPAASLGMATAWRVRGNWPCELAPPTHRIESITELVAL